MAQICTDHSEGKPVEKNWTGTASPNHTLVHGIYRDPLRMGPHSHRFPMLLGFLWEEYGKLTGMGVPLLGSM